MSARSACLSALAVAALLTASSPAFADFDSCLASLRPAALASGVSGETFDSATNGLEPDMKVLDFLDYQPEFKATIWQYLAAAVDDEKIADGRDEMRQWSSALSTAESRFGVDRYIIAAFWGMESDYGRSMGKRPLVRSLATLSCFGRRQAYFRGEFNATLKILEHGDIAPDRLNGSWAGAFGQTQFMPSSFLKLAVDMEGNGRRDIVDSVPDALGSTANFMHRAGWEPGLTWGFEVVLPDGFSGSSSRSAKKPGSFWEARGLRRTDGRGIGSGEYGLFLPMGRDGPAFLVTRNFDAIYRYNNADSYALGVALLSDRLRGGGPLVTPWPTDDRGLSREELKQVQALLNQHGYAVGDPDGAIGTKSREAIADFQARHGLERNGQATGKLLDALHAN